MSVIYNALKKFKNHPQKKKTKKGDAKKNHNTVSFKKLLFSSSALTGCILFSFFIGTIVLFSLQDRKQGVVVKTDETGIIARKIQDREAQTVKNESIDERVAVKTSERNPAVDISAPSGSMDNSTTQQQASNSSGEEDLNRARYLAPHPRNSSFQHELLQDLDGEVTHIGQGILRRNKATGEALSKNPVKSGRNPAYKDNERLSPSSRHLEASSSEVKESRPSGSNKIESESASNRDQSHPAARETRLPVRVRPSTEIIRLIAKIKKSIRQGTAVHTENLLDQLAVLKGSNDRYVLKLRAYWSLQNNDHESAASYLTRVLEKDSEDLEAGINMAIVEINSHRPQMARIRLQKLEKIYPDNLLIADLVQKLQ